jgi:hypothetical protein
LALTKPASSIVNPAAIHMTNAPHIKSKTYPGRNLIQM